jgi:hypothetical protein
MSRVQLGRIVAERVFELRTSAGVRSVTVRIGQPIPDPHPDGDWVCPVTFRGAPRGHLPLGVRPVCGVDALQALVLALGYIQRELTGLQRQPKVTLTWLESDDLGLPDILGPVDSG